MIYLAIWLHTLADFVLQSDWMAKNKSKSNRALGIHVLVYMIPFAALMGPKYAAINGAAHFVIDYFTSRGSGYFYRKGDIHNFFVVIGIDQALHLTLLVVTLPLAIPVWSYFV